MTTLVEQLIQRVSDAAAQFGRDLDAAGMADSVVEHIRVTETGQGVKVSFFASDEAKTRTLDSLKPAPFAPNANSLARLPLIGKDGHLVKDDPAE